MEPIPTAVAPAHSSARTAAHPAAARPGPARAAEGSPSGRFLALTFCVIAAAAVVRIVLLGRQSYWIDEIFSVRMSSGSLRSLAAASATEVHPPLYAGLLWAWTVLGGTSAAWTRLLSTLCALAAVVVTRRGLRGTGLTERVRWALTTATATSGFSVVYSLEARSYALLLLGSVGLTAATLHAALDTLRTGRTRPRARFAWCAWSLLSATTHLFGAVLVLAAAAVLAAVTVLAATTVRSARSSGRSRRRTGGRPVATWGRPVATWAALGGAGCSLQLAWLLAGLARPDFAAGTRWIPAPHAQDVWDLLTTTLAAGGLTPHRDGFAWTSPLGAVAAAALCGSAAVAGLHARRRAIPTSRNRRGVDAEARAAAVLLSLGGVVTAATFGVSQWAHLWTLRNMIVVSPAVLWGIVCLAAALAGTDAGRRHVAVAAVALLGAALVPVTIGVARPYKTDARGLVAHLVEIRAQRPDTTFVFLGPAPPGTWRTASERPDLVRAWDELAAHAVTSPSASPAAARSTSVNGPVVVTVYHGVADPSPSDTIAALVAHVAPAACRVVPVYGFGVVECD